MVVYVQDSMYEWLCISYVCMYVCSCDYFLIIIISNNIINCNDNNIIADDVNF